MVEATAHRTSPLQWALRITVAAALCVDAVVHLRLASNYQMAFPGGVGGGTIFRIESVVAIIAALYVLLRGTRAAYGVAFVVAFSAFVAVIVYRYVEVPQIGPIPSMYEPIWFFEKTLSAVAEGIGATGAALGLVFGQRRSRGRH